MLNTPRADKPPTSVQNTVYARAPTFSFIFSNPRRHPLSFEPSLSKTAYYINTTAAANPFTDTPRKLKVRSYP